MEYLSEVYGQGGIYAKCVAASVANGIPIYTLETKAPKFIDAEFEKHRMLSSNSSSSRAIPFKYLEEVYIPFDIRKNQKGMQGYDKADQSVVEDFIWYTNMHKVSIEARLAYFKDDIHKQHLNRYMEPWTFQKKVVTATEWDNFFNLRLAPDAQPEMQELAKCMKSAIDQAEPIVLAPGQWHLPYVEHEGTLVMSCYPNAQDLLKDMLKCSAARCARVSYNNHDNSNPSVEKDLALADLLLSSKHLTPFEHQATAMDYYNIENSWCMSDAENFTWTNGITHMDREGNFWSGNFRGWIQNRQLVSEWNGS